MAGELATKLTSHESPIVLFHIPPLITVLKSLTIRLFLIVMQPVNAPLWHFDMYSAIG